MMNSKTFYPLILLFALLASPYAVASGASNNQSGSLSSPEDLLVAPTRALFEGGQSTAVVNLINRSSKVLTYRLSFIRYRSDESGGLHEVGAIRIGERFADEFVRFTPRRVVLQPQQTQSVRLLLRKPQDLPDGEYVSFLRMAVTPTTTIAGSGETSDDAGISIKLIPLYGVAIPVIIRNGDLQAQYNLGEMSLNYTNARPYLVFDINKSGLKSLYGNIKVFWSSSDASNLEVGRLIEFAIRSEDSLRHMQIPITIPDGKKLSNGQLTVRLIDAEMQNREKILDEAVLSVP